MSKGSDRYQKPRIRKKKIELNEFFRRTRYLDQEGFLLVQMNACFGATTRISTNHGNKLIETIELEDSIISYNLDTEDRVQNRISAVSTFLVDSYFKINHDVIVTGSHELWVEGRGWTRVREVAVGDLLLTTNNQKLPVDMIEPIDDHNVVYSLHVDGKEHNFFANGILAHNKTGGTSMGACFLEGTKVLMEDDTREPIESIQVGDMVVSYDFDGDRKIRSPVKELHRRIVDGYIVINNTIHSTRDHVYWVNGRDWKPGVELRKGDYLTSSEGGQVEITKLEERVEEVHVYNFDVATHWHNYFAEDILVHNVSHPN